MATLKQKDLALATLNHRGKKDLTKAELVAMGGYGKGVQKTPAKALESKGYKEELAKFGLTEEFITTALVEDIKGKPRKRFFELSLGSEILGMKKRGDVPDDRTPHQTVIIINTPNGNATVGIQSKS